MKPKKKLRWLWGTRLTFVMLMGLLPATALAEGSTPASSTADFSTDPTAALNLLNAAKTGAADSTWDNKTKTLTLNGVYFTTSADTGVKLPADATIVLRGENTIISGNSMSGDSYGIYADGNLAISGTGKLTANSGEAYEYGYGIEATGKLSISGNADVTAKGGTAQTENSYGLYGNNVTISGTAQVTAIGGAAHKDSVGISADDGTVDISGGTGTMTKVTGVSGTYLLPANRFTAPAGKKFKGWATSANGTVISGTTIGISANTTLYAIWEGSPQNIQPTPAPVVDTITYNGEVITADADGEYVSKKAKKPTILKFNKGKKSFKITWKKVKNVSGYQVQYATSKKFTKQTSKKVTYNGNKKFTKTVKKLKGGKKYYVRVRTCKNVKINGKTVKIYSSWSSAKAVTTKK